MWLYPLSCAVTMQPFSRKLSLHRYWEINSARCCSCVNSNVFLLTAMVFIYFLGQLFFWPLFCKHLVYSVSFFVSSCYPKDTTCFTVRFPHHRHHHRVLLSLEVFWLTIISLFTPSATSSGLYQLIIFGM